MRPDAAPGQVRCVDLGDRYCVRMGDPLQACSSGSASVGASIGRCTAGPRPCRAGQRSGGAWTSCMMRWRMAAHSAS